MLLVEIVALKCKLFRKLILQYIVAIAVIPIR